MSNIYEELKKMDSRKSNNPIKKWGTELNKEFSTEEWIQKMWYIYTMEYYSAIKKNEFMKFLAKWMAPGGHHPE